jgi:delta(3,5)-delta(2,4)-dienoyl-CoA isomerase
MYIYVFSSEIKSCFDKLKFDSNCRAVLVSGKGKIFTAGLDLTQFSTILMSDNDELDVGRRGFRLKNMIESFQDSLTSIENVFVFFLSTHRIYSWRQTNNIFRCLFRLSKCPKPVIALVHNACVGGGVDLISACDIRYCTNDAWFSKITFNN